MDNKNVDSKFNEELRGKLYAETFLKDEQEYSPKRVEYLVGLLELDQPTDEQDMEDSLKDFEEKFQRIHSKAIKKSKFKKYCNKLAGIAAVLMLTFMVVDVTTRAVMDRSILHVICRWTNQVDILPEIDADKELSSMTEDEIQYFYTLEDFGEYFSDDFLICSWLPEKMKLEKILLSTENDNQVIIWQYSGSEEINMQLWMQQKGTKSVAGYAGTLIEEEMFSERYINDNKITFYVNNDNMTACFEYNNWWYVISLSPSDDDALISVLEGMINYEKIK